MEDIYGKTVTCIRLCELKETGSNNVYNRIAPVKHTGELKQLYSWLSLCMKSRAPHVNLAMEMLSYHSEDPRGAADFLPIVERKAWCLLLPGIRLLVLPSGALFYPYDEVDKNAMDKWDEGKTADSGAAVICLQEIANLVNVYQEQPMKLQKADRTAFTNVAAPIEVIAVTVAAKVCLEQLKNRQGVADGHVATIEAPSTTLEDREQAFSDALHSLVLSHRHCPRDRGQPESAAGCGRSRPRGCDGAARPKQAAQLEGQAGAHGGVAKGQD